MPVDSPLLIADRISKTYRATEWLRPSRARVVLALQDVSVEINAGRTLGIVGESGSGKSTLARCLAGRDAIDSGTIQLHEEVQADRWRVQLISQDSTGALNPRMFVRDILLEPLQIAGVPESLGAARLEKAMLLAGVPEVLLGRKPAQISGGQRQRVAIARALCVQPKVLIFDESFSGLDLPVQRALVSLLIALQRSEGIGCVVISHDLRLAAAVSDEIAVMEHGAVVERGAPNAVFEAPRHECTKRLLEALPLLEKGSQH
jgi:peptide/nickel transport system ATP-binding protein